MPVNDVQGTPGPYRCIIIATSYAKTVNVIELSSSDPLRSPAVSIWCALPDLIFLIRLWTWSSGKSAQAHKRSRRTAEPRLLFHNRRNETTASRESCANRASAVNRGGDVESYVWIKVILLDMPEEDGGWGWGRGVEMQNDIYEWNSTLSLEISPLTRIPIDQTFKALVHMSRLRREKAAACICARFR